MVSWRFLGQSARVRADIGRFLENRGLEQQKLLKMIYDLGLGCGEDVSIWVHGIEMVIGKGEAEDNRGFLRVFPLEAGVLLSFPRGPELRDPRGRAQGPLGSQTSIEIGHAGEIDLYIRRMIHEAYALEE